MGKIKKNYFYNVSYQLLVLVTPIITAPYLARVLGADNLGIYSYVNTFAYLISRLTLLGTNTYGDRQIAYVRDNQKELKKTLWELWLCRGTMGAIGTILYLLYGVVVNRNFLFYFLMYYPYVLAQYIECTWFYVGMENMKPIMIRNFSLRLINVAGVFLLVKSRGDVWIYLLMIAVTNLIANISLYLGLKQYMEKIKIDWRNVWGHAKGSAYLFLPQLASLLYLQIDKMMLEWLTKSTAQVSFYDQSEKIITIPLTIITSISTVVMPRIANEHKKGNKEIIKSLLIKAGRYALLLAFPMMFGLFMIARQFIPWYLGSEFLPTAYGMMILTPIVLFNSLAGISGSQYFTATNQIRILMKAYVSAAILNILVNVILIVRIGYAGAAIATVGSSFVSVLIQYYYLKKQMDLKELIKYGWEYGIGSVLMTVMIAAITRTWKATPLTTAGQILIGCFVYFLYLYAVKDPVLSEVITMVKQRMKKEIDNNE